METMIIDPTVLQFRKNSWHCKIDNKNYIYTTQADYYFADAKASVCRDAWATLYECNSDWARSSNCQEHIISQYLPLDEANPTKGIRKFLQLIMLQ